MNNEKMQLPSLESEHLFYMEIFQGTDLMTKDQEGRELLISSITGGWFEGKDLKGKVEGIGAGYTTLLPPNQNELNMRLLMRTHDGRDIILESCGFLLLDASMEKKLAKDEHVDPTQYYYRFYLRFQTADPGYSRLNGRCGIGVAGIKNWSTVCFDAYIIK